MTTIEKGVKTPDHLRHHAAKLTSIVDAKMDAKGVTIKIMDPKSEESKNQPLAWYTPATHDVVLNYGMIPGADTVGIDFVTDLLEYGHPSDHAKSPAVDVARIVAGLLAHEVGHSKVSRYITQDWYRAITRKQREVITKMEEVRAEYAMIQSGPSDAKQYSRKALRSSARTLFPSPEEIEELKTSEGKIDLYQWALGPGILIGGRYAVNLVNMYEVLEFLDFTDDILGWERADKIGELCERFAKTDSPASMIAIADEFIAMFPENEEDDLSLPGLLDMLRMIMEEMAEDMEKWPGSSSSSGAPDDMISEEEGEKMATSRSLDHTGVIAEEEEAAREESGEVKDRAHMYSDSGPGSSTKRNPTPEEKSAAVMLGKRLEKLSAPARASVHSTSMAPPGRLRSRAAVAQAADRAQGRASAAQPWARTRRTTTDRPPLTVGILTDVSGSMKWAERFVASASWILNRATLHVNGKAGGAVFGHSAEITARPGKIDQVIVRDAEDGMEAFNEGCAAIDALLNLRNAEGIKLLFVITDGFFVQTGQMTARDKWLDSFVKAGVQVIWMSDTDPKRGSTMPERHGLGSTSIPVVPERRGVTNVMLDPSNRNTAGVVRLFTKAAETAVNNMGRA